MRIVDANMGGGTVTVGICGQSGVTTVAWDSQVARNASFQGLLGARTVDCSTVVGPKQYYANCWFSAFFMCFFVSDKGEVTFRYLREAMVTGGVRGRSVVIPHKYRQPLFYLNLLIAACLDGTLADTEDTNEVVAALERAREVSKSPWSDRVFPERDEYANPVTFYQNLLMTLAQHRRTDLVRLGRLSVNFPDIRRAYSQRAGNSGALRDPVLARLGGGSGLPHCIVIEYPEISRRLRKSQAGTWWGGVGKHECGFGESFVLERHGKRHRYVVDSVVLRNVTRDHFVTFLTCGGEGCMFDGASVKRTLWPVKWIPMASGDGTSTVIVPREPNQSRMEVSFRYSYQAAFYYRVT
jgi:hypothetical protein